MSRSWKIVWLVVASLAYVALLAAVLMFMQVGYLALLLLLVLASVYAWMLFAFLHYRQCRQEELLQVLAAAAESQAPLAPALWAYLHDRPHETLREIVVAVLLCFVFPGYYWIWYRGANYDRKVFQVGRLLEEGYSLSDALRMTPGVASRETKLAVMLGQGTGQLALSLRSLRSASRSRLTTLWLEVVPRLAYPLFLLLVINGILTFWMIFIAPRFQRIYREFKMDMPEATVRAMDLGYLAETYSWIVSLAVPVLAALLVLLLVSPSFRWHFPVVGRLYAEYVRSQILQALSFLLKAGQPAPEALGVLSESDALVGGARRRLRAVCRQVEQGGPLADSLRWGSLLPRAMVPLLRTAEHAGNLPWALGELADLLAQRSARRVQRYSLLLFPVPVVGMGVLVGVIVLGLFMPLITLIDGLAP
jgi:type IV pilus assembly protein PilC